MPEKKTVKKKRGRPRKEFSIRERRDISCGGCKGCPHQIYYSIRFYHNGKRIERAIPDTSPQSIKAVLDQYQNSGERPEIDEPIFPQKSNDDEIIGERNAWEESYYYEVPEVKLEVRDAKLPEKILTWEDGEFVLKEPVKCRE